MKLKFFLTIFLILLVTVGTTTTLHFYYFRAERLRLIDRQIEATASLLSSADFEQVSLTDFEDVDDYFHDVLGSQRAGKLFLIRDRDGKVLFRSRNAEWLPSTPSHEPKWQTITVDEHLIRLLGIQVPQIGKTIQVGMLLDHELFHWRQIDKSFLIYTSLITLLVLFIALLLSHMLLRPLRNLAAYLNYLCSHFDGVSFLREMGEIPAKRLSSPNPKDEFSALEFAIARLSEKVRVNVGVFQSWAAQMAHELKTPLTIIRNAVERLDQMCSAHEKERREMITIATEELCQIDAMITNFLDWSSAEHTPTNSKDFFACSLAMITSKLVDRFENVYQGRLRLKTSAQPRVFANPHYVEQAISNLLTNALKYSPPDSQVAVEVIDDGIVIENKGRGIPEAVMKRLGQPFNFFSQSNDRGMKIKGTGLGLAWLATICKRYGWHMDISNSDEGTVVSITGMGEGQNLASTPTGFPCV